MRSQLYYVYQCGVYPKAGIALFSSLDSAIEYAKARALADKDSWHNWEVCSAMIDDPNAAELDLYSGPPVCFTTNKDKAGTELVCQP